MIVRIPFLLLIFLLFFGELSFASPFLLTEVDPVSEFIEFQNISDEIQETHEWKWSEMTSSGIEKEYEIPSVSLSPKEIFVISSSRKINDSGDTISLIPPDSKPEMQKVSVVVPAKQETKTYQYQKELEHWEWKESTPGFVIDETEEHTPEEDFQEELQEEDELQEEEEIKDDNEEGEDDDESFDDEHQEITEEDSFDEEEDSEEFIEPLVSTDGNIILTEMLPNPEGADGGENEFLELWNAELFPIDIGGWRVEDAGGKGFIFPESTLLQPQEYRAFFRNETGITLNNSEESLFLWNTEDVLVSQFSFHDSADEGSSFVRIDPFGGGEWNIQNTPNTSTQRQVYTQDVILSEMLPNPEGTDGDQNEFLELWNTGPQEVDISGWTLSDAGGKVFLIPENTFLNPDEYRAFFKYETGITLNNTDESLSLYTPNGEKVSYLSFSGSASSGWSVAYSGSKYLWTDTLTPNSPNQITGDRVVSSSSSDSGDSFFPPLDQEDQDIELLITTISPHSKNDYIEVWCKKCDTDLSGVRLYIDSVVYQIPEGTVVATDEMLRFVFGNTEHTDPYKVQHTWVFPGVYKNITRTDETVIIGDANGEILDAVCYADQNGNFISTEKKEVGKLFLQGEWNGDLKEWGCISTQAFPRNTLLSRTTLEDTNSSSDFVRMRGESFSIHDAEPASVFITKIQLQNAKTSFVITNMGSAPVDISDWYFANHSSWLMDIQSSDHTNGILLPGQMVSVAWNPYGAKKYARENMMLSLRSGDGKIQDVLCFNQSKDEKGKQKSQKILSQWYQQHLWEKQKKIPACFEYFHTQYIDTYIRSDFSFPSSVDSYTYSSEHIQAMVLEDIIPEEDAKVIATEEEDQSLFFDSFRTFSVDEGVFFSFDVPKGVSKVRISIPSKEIEWEEKVKGGRVESLFTKPLKRGRYKVQRTLVFRDGREEYLPTDRITIVNPSMQSELESIEITKVLPNPEGKDSGSELLVLQNTGKSSGWVRGWSVVVRRGEKESIKPLPRIFLQAGEDRILQKPFLPTLSNSDTVLALHDSWGEVVDEVSWDIARSGEYFGSQAPVFFVLQKSKKSSSSASSQEQKKISSVPSFPKTHVSMGTILAHREGVLFLALHDLPLFVSFPFPSYLPNASKVFAVGNNAEVALYKGSVRDVRPLQMEEVFFISSVEKSDQIPLYVVVAWGGVLIVFLLSFSFFFATLPSVRKFFKSF